MQAGVERFGAEGDINNPGQLLSGFERLLRLERRVSPHPGPLPEERENRCQSVDESSDGGKLENRSCLLPLPRGEGWGEGKLVAQETHLTKADPCPRPHFGFVNDRGRGILMARDDISPTTGDASGHKLRGRLRQSDLPALRDRRLDLSTGAGCRGISPRRSPGQHAH